MRLDLIVEIAQKYVELDVDVMKSWRSEYGERTHLLADHRVDRVKNLDVNLMISGAGVPEPGQRGRA